MERIRLKLFTLIAVLSQTATAYSAPQKYTYGQENNIAVREMRACIEEMKNDMNNHEAEIRTFEEKLANQEAIIEALREQNINLSKTNQNITKGNISNLEMKINNLDTSTKGLISDLKELKAHANQSAITISSFSQKIGDIEKTLEVQGKNMENFQAALRSVLNVLEIKNDLTPAEELKVQVYRVQAGDSLEKIAKLHKITVKALKELNDLNSDRIVIGQNIKIPSNSL